MVAAEVRVNGQHGAVPPCDVAHRLIDAAAEAVPRKRGTQLARVTHADVADEIRHAVLVLLLDGYIQLIRMIAQLARLIVLQGVLHRLRRGALFQHRLCDLLLRVFVRLLKGFVEVRPWFRRISRQLLNHLLIVPRRPFAEAFVRVRHLRQGSASPADQQQQQRASGGLPSSAHRRAAAEIRNFIIPLPERVFRAAPRLLRMLRIAPERRAPELVNGSHDFLNLLRLRISCRNAHDSKILYCLSVFAVKPWQSGFGMQKHHALQPLYHPICPDEAPLCCAGG